LILFRRNTLNAKLAKPAIALYGEGRFVNGLELGNLFADAETNGVTTNGVRLD